MGQIPFEDLGILILTNPQTTITQAVLTVCTHHNIALIHCNESHLPAGLTLPLSNHSLHSKVIKIQTSLNLVRKKQLWQQIIKAKIIEQAETLTRLHKNHKPISALVTKVKTADNSNVEAQAAQRYWKLLVNKKFKRDSDASGINAQLNYGYAIMRAMIARSLVATGFHPSLGLNHTNQYNSYCLADDVMEPLRPWVDEITINQNETDINKNTKSRYLELLAKTVKFQKKKMPLMIAAGKMASQLKEAYQDKTIHLSFPKRI